MPPVTSWSPIMPGGGIINGNVSGFVFGPQPAGDFEDFIEGRIEKMNP